MSKVSSKDVDRLQYVQNSAARVLPLTEPWQHTTPTLTHLHWLPVKFCILYKIFLLTDKVPTCTGPHFPSDPQSSDHLPTTPRSTLREQRWLGPQVGHNPWTWSDSFCCLIRKSHQFNGFISFIKSINTKSWRLQRGVVSIKNSTGALKEPLYDIGRTSEEVLAPELWTGSYLGSLLVDFWPVWLQRDDSVELVQSQVSILYVLAKGQSEGGYIVLV